MPLTRRVVKNARKRGVTVYNRGGWATARMRALYAVRAVTRRHSRPHSDTLWIHITVTHLKEIKEAMRELHGIGVERFGCGVSYSAAWHPFTGEIAIGQGFTIKGAHTLNDKGVKNYSFDQNKVSHAIAMIGMPGVAPTPQAVDKLEHFVAAMMDEGALTKDPDIVPHSLVAFKDCPTDAMRSRLVSIKSGSKRKAQ